MAAQRPAPGVIPPLRKRVPELARTVVSGPVLAERLVDSASGCCTATASSSVTIVLFAMRSSNIRELFVCFSLHCPWGEHTSDCRASCRRVRPCAASGGSSPQAPAARPRPTLPSSSRPCLFLSLRRSLPACHKTDRFWYTAEMP
jgi:hypothetical protein